jgi:hypothetical protein
MYLFSWVIGVYFESPFIQFLGNVFPYCFFLASFVFQFLSNSGLLTISIKQNVAFLSMLEAILGDDHA